MGKSNKRRAVCTTKIGVKRSVVYYVDECNEVSWYIYAEETRDGRECFRDFRRVFLFLIFDIIYWPVARYTTRGGFIDTDYWIFGTSSRRQDETRGGKTTSRKIGFSITHGRFEMNARWISGRRDDTVNITVESRTTLVSTGFRVSFFRFIFYLKKDDGT